MKKVSEGEIREEARRGKNEPIARTPKVRTAQNGEAEPSSQAAAKQAARNSSR